MNRFVAGKLAPLLLIIVASLQMSTARTTPLTSWKGGGFGMFAELYQRHVKAWLMAPGSLRPVPLMEPRMFSLMVQTRAMPTHDHAHKLAAHIVRIHGQPSLASEQVVVGVYDTLFHSNENAAEIRAKKLRVINQRSAVIGAK